MQKKKQQINKSLTSACQQEKGQLPQETIKLAKGLLKHHGKRVFKIEFKDILGSFAHILRGCSRTLAMAGKKE